MTRSARVAALAVPLALAVSAGVLLAGCGGESGAGGAGGGTASGAGASTPQLASSTGSAAVSSAFTNPVYPTNFPDPQIVADGAGGYIAFATNGNAMNVQSATSDDLVTWRQGSDALPDLPSWSTPGKVWAPEAIRWRDGTYRLYYTTAVVGRDRQCLSVASSPAARGPYRDTSTKPLVCEVDEGGSIDASPFVAKDGTAYLYWKNDGNHIGVDTHIKVAKLAADGRSLAGPATNVLKQDRPWEAMLVEGPNVWEHDGVFHMFYSGNGFWTDKYAVGHAVAKSPTGPFRKDPEPVLVTNDAAAGPGHNSLIQVGDQVWMVYHAWVPGSVGDDAVGRQMWLSQVTFLPGGKVRVEPPTVDHTAAPEGTAEPQVADAP